MGKRAFSAKAKREQLRSKRAASAAASSAAASPPLPLPQRPNAPSPSSGPAGASAGAAAAASTAPRRRAPHGGRGSRGRHAERYKLKFAADSEVARAKARAKAFETVACQGGDEGAAEVVARKRALGVFDVRPRGDARFRGPRRPVWSYEESAEELELRESAYFEEWMKGVQTEEEDAAFFEQNLETWRQLWRVVERSDVLILVVDIRYPALHFVPDLYHFITNEAGKGMVLALNKCDLVSEKLLEAWKTYFENEFSELSVAMFSSFPDAKLAPSEANSELLSKREKRMARSKLAAWGADQLVAAVDTLELPAEKKGYLEQWRKRVASKQDGASAVQGDATAVGECDSLDETAELERLAQLQEKVDNDSTAYSHEESEMVTIGVIGHPNAGKSSLINGVFGRKVVSTSATPGHTKHLQTMFLSTRVRLCDCPGLVFPGRVPRELQVLAGMYPVSQLREPYAVVKYLADRIPVVSILDLNTEVLKLEAENEEPFPGPSGWTAWNICEAWAHKRGFRTAKAARLDVFRAANNILRLAVDGRLVLATIPPGFNAAEAAIEGETDATSKANHHVRTATVLDATYKRSPREQDARTMGSDGSEDYASRADTGREECTVSTGESATYETRESSDESKEESLSLSSPASTVSSAKDDVREGDDVMGMFALLSSQDE